MSIDYSHDPLIRINKLDLYTNITGFLSFFLNSYEVSSLTLKTNIFTS